MSDDRAQPDAGNDSPLAAPLLSYAEPATYAASSWKRWLKRRLFLLIVQGALLVSLLIIGGTLGSTFLQFEPRFPWQALLLVHASPFINPRTRLLQSDRDDLAAPEWADRVVQAEPSYAHSNAYSASEIRDRTGVSRFGSDGTFTVSIRAESELQCNRLLDAYRAALEFYSNTAPRPPFGDARRAQLSNMAEYMNMFIGMGGGLLLTIGILWFSHYDFKRRALSGTP